MNTEKSPEAFRTISEVADWLGTPAHVLRFWESRFPQIKPVKRAGGRRYYRPADMELLGGIKRLLHDDGMTIRGVQKLLREHGVRRVADLSPRLAVDAEGTLVPGLARERDPDAPPGPLPLTDRFGPGAQPAPARDARMDRDMDPGPDPDTHAAPPPADPDDDADRGAPMAEDLPTAPPDPAEVVPFLLSARVRTAPDTAPESTPAPAPAWDRGRTPDLFDLPAPAAATATPDAARPGPVSAPAPATADPLPPEPAAAPRLRMPAIPPDPSETDPLPAAAPRRPVLPRRAAHPADDRLVRLFARLQDLRDRMDRADR